VAPGLHPRPLAVVLEESHADAVSARVAGAPGSATVQVLDVTNIGDFRFPADLQVLVNNAGVRLSSRPIEVIEASEWRRTDGRDPAGVGDREPAEHQDAG
jgi:NAD(P)-dependent dehydrogenase (short-subunit alcohol dehydrogenase family)